MRFFGRFVLIVLVVAGIGGIVFQVVKGFSDKDETAIVASKNSILVLPLDSVILNGKKFLETLKTYRENPNIKAILMVVDSPGGAVGPSQEIFAELLRTKEEFKKPLVCVSSGLIASGAYYAAIACDRIIVAPGALIGSIGVIMQFANLERLYEWAKVSRYSITSGRFKDSGAEYRSMREDERALFQEMIDSTYSQFRSAVQKQRSLSDEDMDVYADGRVMTGDIAVAKKFADRIGYFEDAVDEVVDLAQLGEDYRLFEAPEKKRGFWDFASDGETDNVNSYNGRRISGRSVLVSMVREVLGLGTSRAPSNMNFSGQPFYMLPAAMDAL